MFHDDMIEELSGPGSSPLTILARKEGQPRLCADYHRSTLNKLFIRRTWPRANMEVNLDSVSVRSSLRSRLSKRLLANTRSS